ncbi:MAG TPA: peptidoglycan-binding protein, partial [Acidisarcina sp.]
SHSKRKSSVHQIHGQRQIDAGRAREIQSALIRENYLTGEATGNWDQQSQQAMQQYQADHHWQTKIIPDSRALIKLGLGPAVDNNAVAVASAPPLAPAPKSAQPVKFSDRAARAKSGALTLADAHSIFN